MLGLMSPRRSSHVPHASRSPRATTSMGADGPPWPRVLGLGLTGAAAAFVLTGGLLSLGARVLARLPLVPQGTLRAFPNVAVRAVHPDRLHLDATAETARRGWTAIRQQGGATRVRLGPVTHRPTPTTVARPILGIDGPEPPVVARGNVNAYYWSGDPRSAFGLEMIETEVDSPVGHMPAWLVPAADGPGSTDGADWAILIHGHGASREETLRAVPLLHALGITALIISYRNDAGAPASADRMYHLGSAEWEDADAAIEHALARGARRIVLLGWSMGGGIALRTAEKSAHADRIAGLVLVSPAIDWSEILMHHATALRAPAPVRRLALWMMTSRYGHRAVRLREPLALHEMRAEHYAKHLQHRTLITHGTEDSTVPIDGSIALAGLRPDLVDLEVFRGASHTREWNQDPARWERLVVDHLARVLQLPSSAGELTVPVVSPEGQLRRR